MNSSMIFLFFFAFLLAMAQSASITSPDHTDEKSVSDCQACEYIMKFLRFQTLNQAQTADAIKEKVNSLFRIIPPSEQNDEYFLNLEKYLKMIKNGKTPQDICMSIMKCSSKQLALPRITMCQVCTAVVDLIKFELTISNATLQLIIKAVEEMCALFGDVPVYEECMLILKEINQIIQWLEEELTPTDICIRLGFCNKTAINKLVTDYTAMQLHKNSSDICDMCKMVVSKLNDLLKNVDKKLNDLKDTLDGMCDDLGTSLADQCKSVVDMVLDEVKEKVEYIEEMLDPTEICQALQLCSSSIKRV